MQIREWINIEWEHVTDFVAMLPRMNDDWLLKRSIPKYALGIAVHPPPY